jgi:hypothetical protein
MTRTRSSLLLATLVICLLAACQPATPPPPPTDVSPSSARPEAVPTAGSAKPAPPSGPLINGFLKPYGADGADWPPNVEVSIQVYDQPQGKVIFTTQSKTDEQGRFYRDVGVTTLPGMAVAVTYGQTTRSVTLVPVAVTRIDVAAHTVAGTATPGAHVVVWAGDRGQLLYLETDTSEAGLWTVDFSSHLDFTDAVVVQAVVRDAALNGTAYKIGLK